MIHSILTIRDRKMNNPLCIHSLIEIVPDPHEVEDGTSHTHLEMDYFERCMNPDCRKIIREHVLPLEDRSITGYIDDPIPGELISHE